MLPKERLNEVASFVKGGLQDLSISRTTFDWGIRVPGTDKHIIYVWVDALTTPAHAPVQMRARGAASRPHFANDVAGFDFLPDRDQYLAHMQER